MTRPALLIAALAAATLAAVGCGRGYDPYDDDLRGTNPSGSSRLVFGQRIGPDGDGCWPENDRDYSGRVFCDLVSLGGLHWDAGDVKVAKSADILMGSGYVCIEDEDGAPWCWEWSQDVRPQPARVPEGEQFNKIRGTDGVVCGQNPSFRRFVCWTVGADRPDYRQAVHRTRDGSEWAMSDVKGEPPRLGLHHRESGLSESFHAFTGQEMTRPVESPRVLVTETLP